MIGRDLQAPFALPSGAVEVVFVRHGASVTYADTPILEGRSNPNLSALGQIQAVALANVLSRSDPSPAALFVTPLRRTVQTAGPTAAALGATPTVIAELSEIGLGQLEGLEFVNRSRAGDPLLKRVFEEERWDVLPGAESMAAFGRRVSAGMAKVIEGAPALSTVIVFTHGGVIAEACCQVTGSRRFAFTDVENGSLTKFTVDSGAGWRLRSFNDTAHLMADSAELR